MVKKVLILDTPGCASCKYAEELIAKIKKEEKLDFKIEVKDITKHPEVLQKYQIMSAPGIVIDGKLKFTGKPGENDLRKALKSTEFSTRSTTGGEHLPPVTGKNSGIRRKQRFSGKPEIALQFLSCPKETAPSPKGESCHPSMTGGGRFPF